MQQTLKDYFDENPISEIDDIDVYQKENLVFCGKIIGLLAKEELANSFLEGAPKCNINHKFTAFIK